jgi:hypothetical protein
MLKIGEKRMNDEVILQTIERTLVSLILKGELLKIDYANRIDISAKCKEIYNSLDWSNIQKLVIREMEEIVAKKIVDNYITEFSSDIKKSLSNSIIREELRSSMDIMINRMLKTIREVEPLD